MSLEPRNIPEENFGALQGCLVEGDAEQQEQQRRIRRRSLTISVLLQAAALVAVVLVPLFARTERIALANVTPVPPYSPYREVTNGHSAPSDPGRKNRCHFCVPPRIPEIIVMHRHESRDDSGEPILPGAIPGGSENRGLIPLVDARPHQPEQPPQEQIRPRTLHFTNIDPAMLKHRVDPVYPALMKQTHREGRVEIHAVIAEDGTMQSLQAVGGDPLFFASALEAVQQWIYKPTYLNGKPVQVDTTITVIYSMQH